MFNTDYTLFGYCYLIALQFKQYKLLMAYMSNAFYCILDVKKYKEMIGAAREVRRMLYGPRALLSPIFEHFNI